MPTIRGGFPATTMYSRLYLHTKTGFLLLIVTISTYAAGQTMRRVPAGSGNTGNMTTGSNSVPGGSGTVTNGSPNSANSTDPSQQDIWKVALELGLTPDQRTQFESSVTTYNTAHANLDKAIHEAQAALALALTNGQTFLDVEIEGVVSANSKMQEANLKLWAGLFAICTPDQQKQMLNMQTALSQAAGLSGTTITSQSQ
jgi:hypothetical protein